MIKTIKAKYSGGVIKPLEKLDIEEGRELTVTITEEGGEQRGGADPLDVTFGGWVGLVDATKLKEDIYADRLVSTRSRVEL